MHTASTTNPTATCTSGVVRTRAHCHTWLSVLPDEFDRRVVRFESSGRDDADADTVLRADLLIVSSLLYYVYVAFVLCYFLVSSH